MGRVFEKRKHKIFARNAKLSKMFTRIGKEIAIAVKIAGPLPANNLRLKQAMQNAKGCGMPKDRVEAAIKRSFNKDVKDYEEVLYEAFAPYGVALLIETATDNTTRTVANMRMHLNRGNGTLSTSGSVSFLFERKGLFKFPKNNHDLEELELELIDFGLIDIIEDDGNVFIYSSFEDFGKMSKALEDKGIETSSAELVREPINVVELTEEQETEIHTLIEKIEEDEDVNSVYHNMG